MTSGNGATPFDPATLNERLIQREARRREALDLNITTPAGLEGALSSLSAEVTAEAAERQARAAAADAAMSARSRPSKP